jgi:hypothetical protein
MAQYIDKSALVAELKKRFDYRVNGLKAIDDGTFWKEEQNEDEFNAVLTRCSYNAVKNEVFELMCFLDTLEVKEVDLESEWVKYFENRGDMVTVNIKHLAKHFFELGMSVSNKIQKGEEYDRQKETKRY